MTRPGRWGLTPFRLALNPFRLLIGLAGLSVAAALIAVALLYADLRGVAHLIAGADRPLLAVIVGLAVLDHGIRFARWHLLMQQVANVRLSIGRSLVAYLAGGTMIFTPARIGEVSKSTYARRLMNVPVASTIPILVAERIADVCVMAGLASIGLLLVGQLSDNWPPLVAGPVLALGVVAGVMILRRSPSGWRKWARWLPVKNVGTLNTSARPLEQNTSAVGDSIRALLTRWPLATNVSLGLVAWLIEVAIYALVIRSIGEAVEPPLFVVALAVFPLASLIGALSLVPGGLGATEGSLAALGAGLAGMAIEASLAIGLIARAAILLVVIVTGLLALVIVIVLSQRRSSI